MPAVDHEQFTRDGFFLVPEAIPPDELESLRASYDVILERQKEIWRNERGPDDPPGGHWDIAPQPRIGNTEQLIDTATANAVEVWLSDTTRGVAEQLLSQPVAGISQMMVMCNPTREHGPANWHRDVHPIDMGPMRCMQESLIENGPNYLQWNIPLYDDDVFWVVPGSHLRLNTDAENRQLSENPRVPLPGGVQVKLKAGDGLVYTNYLLHWGSNYTARTVRRTLHGGHTTYPCWDDIGFKQHLSPESGRLFESWSERTDKLRDATESCLRAVQERDRTAFLDGLEIIHPGAGPAGRLQIAIWLCKAAMNCYLLKRPDFDSLPETARPDLHYVHPITLNWGPSFAERFTKTQAEAIWGGFAELERHLRAADGEDYVPGYQSGPIVYYLDRMREEFDLEDLFASWDGAA